MSWNPGTSKEEPRVVSVPECDVSDAGSLEAWYGNFGFVEHYRKVVLANCREIERAKAASEGVKYSESRLDDLARLNSKYVDFLIVHLNGRRIREDNVRASYGR